MDNKVYYRLGELEFHHRITRDELRYHVEQNSLKLSFLFKEKQFIIGTDNHAAFEFVGHGKLSGVFSASNEHSAALFTKPMIKTKALKIRKLNSVHTRTTIRLQLKRPIAKFPNIHPKS